MLRPCSQLAVSTVRPQHWEAGPANSQLVLCGLSIGRRVMLNPSSQLAVSTVRCSQWLRVMLSPCWQLAVSTVRPEHWEAGHAKAVFAVSS